MKKLSYVLIGDDRGKQLENEAKKDDSLMLSGLYLWSTTFNKFGKSGMIEPIWRKEDLEDYDIVHVNYTPSNIQLPHVIREELGDSDTKLVLNVDLDISHWGASWAYHMHSMVRELKLADIIFHVETTGARALIHLLDRNVFTTPHPVDVSSLYDHILKEREPIIGSIFHRYTGESMIHYIAQKNIPLRRVLFGYQPIGKQPMTANAGMYDQVMMYQDFKTHIDEIAKSALGCDLYSGLTYGRAVVEFAALGIPAVVSNTIEASNKLFPYTTINPFDTGAAEEKFRELLTNEIFVDDVIKLAHENCKYYSMEKSYRRFVDMIDRREEI